MKIEKLLPLKRTQRKNYVISTSMRRHHVASTFIRRHFGNICPREDITTTAHLSLIQNPISLRTYMMLEETREEWQPGRGRSKIWKPSIHPPIRPSVRPYVFASANPFTHLKLSQTYCIIAVKYSVYLFGKEKSLILVGVSIGRMDSSSEILSVSRKFCFRISLDCAADLRF